MQNILIIGGTGIVGSAIHRILQQRNPTLNILIGTRSPGDSTNEIQIDVNDPSSLMVILSREVHLIVLSVNDPQNHVLQLAMAQGIDYLDLSKPTPALQDALSLTDQDTALQSRIVFGSGWMGGIVPGLAQSKGVVTSVELRVYYSVRDKAGATSAHFMAENVLKPYVRYQDNKPLTVQHFLDSERYDFSFDLGRRQVYNFDTPDLYILHQAESVPTVQVKMTYNSKIITRILAWMQRLGVFKRMSLKARQKVFGGSGPGDIAVFEIVVQTTCQTRKILLKCDLGQAELTAFSTVLHLESLLRNNFASGRYFAHQLYRDQELVDQLQQHTAITLIQI